MVEENGHYDDDDDDDDDDDAMLSFREFLLSLETDILSHLKKYSYGLKVLMYSSIPLTNLLILIYFVLFC